MNSENRKKNIKKWMKRIKKKTFFKLNQAFLIKYLQRPTYDYLHIFLTSGI
jgi:hypothetical protein